MEKLFYALRNGVLVSIKDVESGLSCNCVCPCCEKKLVAKKGNIKIHHFAHKNKESCEYGYETSLHLLAKEILAKAKTILLPKITFGGNIQIDLLEEQLVKINNVFLEKTINDIKPDIILDTELGKICVEIYVTHKVDVTKLSKIEKIGIDTIEIDLSKRKTISYDELKNVLLKDTSLKTWIYNKKISDTKQNYLVDINSLKNCSKQKGYKPNVIYCITHCEKFIKEYESNDEDAVKNQFVYCLDASNLKSLKEPEEKFCQVCGLKLEVDYGKYGAFYKCECCNVIKGNAVEYNKYCTKCGKLLVLGKYSRGGYYKKYLKCINNYCDYTENL